MYKVYAITETYGFYQIGQYATYNSAEKAMNLFAECSFDPTAIYVTLYKDGFMYKSIKIGG